MNYKITSLFSLITRTVDVDEKSDERSRESVSTR
jgi:hypothetical protein